MAIRRFEPPKGLAAARVHVSSPSRALKKLVGSDGREGQKDLETVQFQEVASLMNVKSENADRSHVTVCRLIQLVPTAATY